MLIKLTSWCCRDTADPLVPQQEFLFCLVLKADLYKTGVWNIALLWSLLENEENYNSWTWLSFLNKKLRFRVPLWLSRIRTQHCHCSSLASCYGTGSLTGPGISTCHSTAKKRKKKKLQSSRQTNFYVVGRCWTGQKNLGLSLMSISSYQRCDFAQISHFFSGNFFFLLICKVLAKFALGLNC